MVAEVEKQDSPHLSEALAWPDQVRSVQVTDQASYEQMAGLKLTLAGFRKKIVGEFKEMKDAANRAHKAICAKENEHLKPIEEAEQIAGRACRVYEDEQDRIRREAQAKIDAENRRIAEEDRIRREAEAKVLRDAELARQAEQRAADDAARLKAAEEAQVIGASEETLNQILETPVIEVAEVPPIEAFIEPAEPVMPVVVAPTIDRMKGLGIRRTWGARVVSIKDLCRAVADGKQPESYVVANMQALNARAKADKTAMRVPGVVAVEN